MRFNTIKRNLWYLCEQKNNVESVRGLGCNRGTQKNGAQVDASHLLCYGVSLGGRGGYFKIMLMRAVTSLTLISPSPLISHTSLL